MTTDDLIAYYVGLLIIQYINKPRAAATVTSIVNVLVGSQIIQQVEDGFDLDTAIGVQLDAIGTYRGASRNIVGLNLGLQYFTFPAYADSVVSVLGFAEYTDTVDPFWYFATYADSSTLLTDPDFRLFIQYLCGLQSLDLTMMDIDNFLFEFFGSYVTLVDNENMTITYSDNVADPSKLFKIVNYTGNLPHPAGVAVNVS